MSNPHSIVKGLSGTVNTTAGPGGVITWSGTAPTAWNITLPSPAANGDTVTVNTDTTLGSLVTIQAGSGHTMSAAFTAQTINAKASVKFIFNAPTLSWFQVR